MAIVARPRTVRVPPFATAASGRNLLDQHGAPWFGVGDAAWSLVGQLSTSSVTSYLTDRAAKGFRLVLFSAPEFYYATNAPNNINNDPPFTGTAFASSLGEAYWSVVDHAIDTAAALGITCLICPAYYGQVSNDGVLPEFTNASTAQVFAYGQALGARYGGRANVIWLAGHDEDPTSYAGLVARYEQLQAGIVDGGATQMWVPGSGDNSIGLNVWSSSSMSFAANTVYDRNDTPVAANRSAWDGYSEPIIYIEGKYENEFSSTPLTQRYQAWGSFVAGAPLHIFGNSPIWHFNSQGGTDWTTHLSDPATVDMTHLADLLAAHPWQQTAPDTTDTFLTAGEQSGTTQAGARFGAGLGLVYMPTTRAVTLDLTEITAGACTITRIDPSSGAESVLTTVASGSGHVVSSQGTNAASDSDWALLVQVTG